MYNTRSVKRIITEAVLIEIPQNDEAHQHNIDDIIFKWWFTGRQVGGLRLTSEGMLAFGIAGIECYDYNFVQEGASYHNFLLNLNKKMKCPYYLGVDNLTKKLFIRVYDSKIAMMLGLYGSLDDYLASIKNTPNI
jgi:hypothetical protein